MVSFDVLGGSKNPKLPLVGHSFTCRPCWHLSLPDSSYTLKEKDLDSLLAFAKAARSPHQSKVVGFLERLKHRPVASLMPDLEGTAQLLSQKLGKELRIVLRGGRLHLDPKRFDPLLKSLIHAIRNACDHGIESPERREQLGKKMEGTVLLSFAAEADGSLKIQISDDGAGMNADRIKKKALDLGLLRADEAKTMKREEILNLIFANGFSTAEKVSDVSGRGLGMSCIRHEVEALDGTIRLKSQVDVGSICEIRVGGVFKAS